MKRLCLSLLTGSILVVFGLAGCAAAPTSQDMAAESGGAMEAPLADTTANQAQSETVAQKAGEPPTSNVVAQRPQLIKKANLSLRVDSLEEGLAQVREIINAQQGDLFSLTDQGESQRQITAQFRIPADRLDATLDSLTEVGTVLNRSITTEDVSSQLVDLQARISNARQSEKVLKEIMSRSGDISDVLEVSRELSNTRQSIEQMAAQQQSLQAQVRYSTISLSLQSAIASSPNKPAFSRQLANSWEAATSSVGDFTTDLLQLGLWLLAYSPYLAILLCGAAIARKVTRRSPQ
ncbi:MAG: DUF4349 domain-containing protein [Phormidesmis sp.]